MIWQRVCVVIVALFCLAACGTDDVYVGIDTKDDDPAQEPVKEQNNNPDENNTAPTAPEWSGDSTEMQSNGGGFAQSQNFQLRAVVGAPTPVGFGQTKQYRVLLGAGHVQHHGFQTENDN